MIKITLKNGTIVEFDSPKEASQFMHSLYWLEYRGSSHLKQEIATTDKPKEIRLCKICHDVLPKGKQTLCNKESCKREAKKRYQRKWHKDHAKNKPESFKVPITIKEPTAA